jgi:hypothetical protein
VKHLFSTMPKTEIFSKSSWIETEVNGGHWGDRMLNRTRSRHDRMRPVSGSSSLARDTRASHRRVRSVTGLAGPVKSQKNCETREVDRTRWHVRSRSTGRWHCGIRSVLAARLVAWSATRISGDRTPRRVRSILIGASGHSSA